MFECSVFHNGSSDLPTKRSPAGIWINEGNLDAIHSSVQRVIRAQVRQAVLADRLGFDYWFQTEHHFEVEGNERNSATLAVQSAIAVLTSRIRIGQLANILPWWHPVRLASFVAALDVLSGGRVEFGIGRGYQSRESEVFGQLLGTTMMDEEKNRAFYEEAYDFILQAWTTGSLSYQGKFLSIPPPGVLWNNAMTEAKFGDPATEYSVDRVLDIGENGPPNKKIPTIYNTTTTVKEVSIFPQPLQKPYPQTWTPVTSERSIGFAAAHGINAYFASEGTEKLRDRIRLYYQLAEESGWADRLDRGQFKYGWDAERRRGVAAGRVIYVTENGLGSEVRFRDSVNTHKAFFDAFGFYDATTTGDPYDQAKELGLTIIGSNQEVIDKIMQQKEYCGYDEDYFLGCWFEHPSLSESEIEGQMQNFAENIMPVIAAECGGRQEKPAVEPVARPADLVPGLAH